MTKKYSKVYTYQYGASERKFRYNYTDCKLEYICKPNADMLEDIYHDAVFCKLEWLRVESVDNLISYAETGYVVISSDGLRPDSWKEAKNYYMDMMSENIACMCNL